MANLIQGGRASDIVSGANMRRKYASNLCQQDIPKNTWEIRITMSYVEKIISDIIKTTSDLFPISTNI